MVNIINQIIEIDAIAQKQLNNAGIIKEQYLKELEEKTQINNDFLQEKADKRITAILQTEEKIAKEEKDIIAKETDMAIKRIEDNYKKNHIELENSIFKNVIMV